MNILVFGGSGFTGLHVVEEVLRKGHRVAILTRKSNSVSINNPNLTVIEGDVLKSSDVLAALEGKDAVIQCLGISGKGDGQPNNFVSSANKIIVQSMEALNIQNIL